MLVNIPGRSTARLLEQSGIPSIAFSAPELILAASRLVNRNITAGSGRTSMRLEPEIWDALREICLREGIELRDLIQRIEPSSGEGGRTSAVRVYVLQYFRTAATDGGHLNAGHGVKSRSPSLVDGARRRDGRE
jgi:predicted DNA-binding ribbon-helix-helix protein